MARDRRGAVLCEPLDNVGHARGHVRGLPRLRLVLTANHVGAGDVSSSRERSTRRCRARGPAGQRRRDRYRRPDPVRDPSRPDLPQLPIAVALAAAYGSDLLIAGNGLDRGTPTRLRPQRRYPPGPIDGLYLGLLRPLRYGTNQIEVYPAGGRIFNTEAFGSLLRQRRAAARRPGRAGRLGRCRVLRGRRRRVAARGHDPRDPAVPGPAPGQLVLRADDLLRRSALLPPPDRGRGRATRAGPALAPGAALDRAARLARRSASAALAQARTSASRSVPRRRSGSPRASRRGPCSGARSRRASGSLL